MDAPAPAEYSSPIPATCLHRLPRMYHSDSNEGPSTRGEWWIAGGALVLLLGLFIAEICIDYTPVKLSALLVVVFWIPLLALHEGGHAVAARLLGWHVGQVVIGMGKAIGKFRVGTAIVELRVIPIEGFVRCVPTRLRRPQTESALIYFAGPGVELLLALLVLLLIGSDRLFTASEDYSTITWQSLAVAGTSQAVLNLLPFAIRTKTGTLLSDGLGICASFLRPEAYYAQMIGMTFDVQEQEWQAYDPADWWKRGG